MKKLLLLLGIFLFPFISADSIDSLTIDSNVFLNHNQTIYAVFNATDCENVLCSLIVFDDENKPVYRASDEYTNNSCIFSTEFEVFEPVFKRGRDYNIVVYCDGSSALSEFRVDNREPIGDYLVAETFFLKDNPTDFIMSGIFIVMVLAMFGIFYVVFS